MTTSVKDKCHNVNINDYVMPVNEWQKRFEDEYYSHLARLTGLKQNGHTRPKLWGQITKSVIYDHFPDGVYQTLKSRQVPGDKLHQQLTAKGIEMLKERQKTILLIMSQCNDLDSFLYKLSMHDLESKQIANNLFDEIDNVYQEAMANARELALTYAKNALSKHINTSKKEVLERLAVNFLAA